MARPPLALATAILGCLTATVASAQITITTNSTPTTITTSPTPALPPRSFAEGRRMSVTTNFQVALPSPQINSTADMTAAMTAASGMLFDVVGHQCDVLTATLKGACRLVQMNVTSNVNTRNGNGGPTVTASANATYEIEPEAASQTPAPPK